MRSSRATWILVAAIAATTCIHTGCGFSRMGQNVGNMSVSRPRLMSWRKDKPDNDLASATARPPRSSIPPSGAGTGGSGSRSFPSEPASNYDYASTSRGGGDYSRESGSGDYSRTDSTDNYGEGYVARSESSAASQRGFYNPEYQGTEGGSRFASSQSGGDYDYRSTGAAARGYDSEAGSSSPYGPSYGGSGTRDQNYQQVADRRGGYDDSYGGHGETGRSQYGDGTPYGGDSQYGGNSQYGNSQYSASDYDAPPSGGGSTYSSTRQVSPSGGSPNYDDYRSPAQDSYDDSYGTSGGYDSTHGATNTGGGTGTATGGSTSNWLPGSTGRTTPYGQKQLSPPTNSNWGN